MQLSSVAAIQTYRRFVEARSGAQEREEECEVAAAGYDARELWPENAMKRRKVIAGDLGKQVVFEVIVLVEQEERDDRIGEHGAACEIRIMGIGDAVLRKATNSREQAYEE